MDAPSQGRGVAGLSALRAGSHRTRHSRKSENLGRTDRRNVCLLLGCGQSWIPAYAGMTEGGG